MSIVANGKTYTELELIERVWDKEKINDLMNRRVFYGMAGRRREELEELWVREPEHRATASFGKNYGWYVGMDEIFRYYVTKFEEERQAVLDGFCAADASIANCAQNRMIGCSMMSPMSTALVELAEDGQSAQGMWYTIGQQTASSPDGNSTAVWQGEKVAADFLKEDGQWKLWHLVISTDFINPAGTNHSSMPLYYAAGEDPVEREFGTPTIRKLTHDRTLHWSDNYPPMPQPYQTYEDKMGYGPEGWRTDLLKPASILQIPEVNEHA